MAQTLKYILFINLFQDWWICYGSTIIRPQMKSNSIINSAKFNNYEGKFES